MLVSQHIATWPLLTSAAPQIWSKNIKVKSIDLTALKKHGKVYDDGKFLLCLHLLQSSSVSDRQTTLLIPPRKWTSETHYASCPQSSLAAWSGRTQRPTSSTWLRRRGQRQSHTSRFVFRAMQTDAMQSLMLVMIRRIGLILTHLHTIRKFTAQLRIIFTEKLNNRLNKNKKNQ